MNPTARRTLVASLGVLALGCSEYEVIKKQGNDVFYQEPPGEVDILLTVDNSCSMDPYQQKLSENFDSFLTYLDEAQVQYHIGVVTTTINPPAPVPEYGCTTEVVQAIPEGGHLVGGDWITNDTENAQDLFTQMVSLGICGSGYEMGLESAWRALSPPISIEENLGFLRDAADLSLIFVSDEEDGSPDPVNDYINAFRDIKGQRDRDVFNASALVVMDEADCPDQVATGSSEGSRYVDVATQGDGVLASICAEDFASILTEISLRSSRLIDTFYLSVLPAPDTLSVYVYEEDTPEEEEVDPIPCDAGVWTYETEEINGETVGKIVFSHDALPPPQSKVIVRFDYGSGDPGGFCSSGGDTGGEG